MTRGHLLAAAACLALGSSFALAQGQPQDLLPPSFENPAPAPVPSASAQPGPAPSPSPAPSGSAGIVDRPGDVVQPVPVPRSGSPTAELSRLPTLRELENLSTDELDELLGLRPSVDIPLAAQRSLERVGILSAAEGGVPHASFANQPASLVRAALSGTNGPLVSRWGHILLRRALASRLAPPSGMNPVEFAGLRARLLNRLGEHGAARALVQDVDTANYDRLLTAAAIDAYIGTADLTGACPAVRIGGVDRDDAQWRMLAGICNAYAGEASRAGNDLRRLLNSGKATRIDALLAQRYAGAAGNGRRAVTIEWDGVEELTPLRFALANAVGEDVPDSLLQNLGPYYRRVAATAPMLAPPMRVRSADYAASEGILSARALVDLFSQIYAIEDFDGEGAALAQRLREAYVDDEPAARLDAIRAIWDGPSDENYGRYVLTAYAAARMPADEAFRDDAAGLVVAMLAAGLDRDAQRWVEVVETGSLAWAILAAATPNPSGSVSESAVVDFVDGDGTTGQRKGRLLVAGLAGLGRLDPSDVDDLDRSLNLGLDRQSGWTRRIARSAQLGNVGMVALFAGLGMQGESWERMTPLHLFHIVRSLEQVGLKAEARMIAAEAVARG